MSIKKLFLERYLSDEKMEEGYYLRIRRNKKNTEENIKVYYVGFKIFDLTIKKKKNGDEEILLVNPQIFIPNSKNVYKDNKFISCYESIPDRVMKDAKVMEDYFDMEIGSCSNGYCKLDFLFASGAKDKSIDELDEIVKLVSQCFDIDIKKEVKLEKIKSKNLKEDDDKYKIHLILNKNKISFKELYYLRLKLLDSIIYKLLDNDSKKRYFQNVNLNLKFVLNKDINELDLELIENALVNRSKIYAGLDLGEINNINKLIDKFLKKEDSVLKDINKIDYLNTKSLTNQEKQKQQDFMVVLNNSNRDDIRYITKDDDIKILYSKDVYPFELEYVIYAGEEKEDDKGFEDEELSEEKNKRSRENIKGRIDNTLVNGNEALFVEIKYGNEVIDKSNGIHKHLIDLYYCLKMNKQGILRDYYHRVKERNEIIDNKKEMCGIHKIRYDIVCIYNNNDKVNEDKLSYNAVKNKIDDIYNMNCYDGMKIDIESVNDKIKICSNHNDENICMDVNGYCSNLLKKNVFELIKMIDDLGCEVKILLVDDKFKNFCEYVYND